MTAHLDRRSFVRNVTGAAAAGVLAPGIVAGELGREPRERTPIAPANALVAAFGAAPGLLTRLDPTTGATIDAAPWALQTTPGDDLRALLQPVSDADIAGVDAWFANNDGDMSYSANDGTVAAALLRSDVLGSLNLGDVVAPFLASVQADREIALEMRYILPEVDAIDSPIITRDPATALPIMHRTARGGTPTSDWRVPIQVTPSLMYQLRYSGDSDVHPFGKCERRNVRHIHWEVMRRDSRGNWPYILNYHVGIVKEGSQRCLVIWENIRTPDKCLYKRCSWTRQDLQRAVEMVILAAAVAAGVILAGWLIAAVSASVTAVLFPALLVL